MITFLFMRVCVSPKHMGFIIKRSDVNTEVNFLIIMEYMALRRVLKIYFQFLL